LICLAAGLFITGCADGELEDLEGELPEEMRVHYAESNTFGRHLDSGRYASAMRVFLRAATKGTRSHMALRLGRSIYTNIASSCVGELMADDPSRPFAYVATETTPREAMGFVAYAPAGIQTWSLEIVGPSGGRTDVTARADREPPYFWKARLSPAVPLQLRGYDVWYAGIASWLEAGTNTFVLTVTEIGGREAEAQATVTYAP